MALADLVLRALPQGCEKIYVAYSGGVDSHVLLHACASLPVVRDKMAAIYINHGLQQEAEAWGEHCRRQCDALGVVLLCIKVDASARHGDSPEQAAREARYQAMRDLMQANDVLLVAQHREDQLETVLLQLFRGAGVQGLAAMPARMAFGKGTLLRPLLDTDKDAIDCYARQQQLMWVTDPSNRSSDFDRNFLRNEVLPLLKCRWPSLDKTVARTAELCAQAQHIIERQVAQWLTVMCDSSDNSLDIRLLQDLSVADQCLVLRQWLALFGLKSPSKAILTNIVEQVVLARQDACPTITVCDHLVKRYRQRLFCMSQNSWPKFGQVVSWPNGQTLQSLGNGISVICQVGEEGIDRHLWLFSCITLRPRQGGEKLKLPGRSGQHELKKLYQEAAVPPWERDARPLIYLDDRLAAVSGLWIDEWALAKGGVNNIRVVLMSDREAQLERYNI